MKILVEAVGVLLIATAMSGGALWLMSRDDVPPASTTSGPGVIAATRAPSPAVAPIRTEASPQPTPQTTHTTRESPVQPEQATRTSAEIAARKSAPPAPAKEPALDPAARVALSFVGTDPLAEAYWNLAINDPGLPPTERQDLIEDLNEDGLSDPTQPSAEDLPIILARLAILEALALDPLDEVNAEAFDEAYRDLLNLALVALGWGEPVR